MKLPPKKTCWVLIRGLARSSGHWGAFLDGFQKAFPNDSILCVDLPGTGENYQEESPAKIEKIVEQIHEKTLKSEVFKASNERFLVGISLGGMVAAHWAVYKPALWDGLVLMNPSFKLFSPFYKRLSPSAYFKLLKIVLEKDVTQRERKILELTTQKPEAQEELENRVKIYEKHPISRANFIRQLMAASQYAPDKKPPSMPILLLNSLGDKLVHPDCSLDIQNQWKVKLHRHAWAGHDLPLDDPNWVMDHIKEWHKQQPKNKT